ncbi:glycosyltransferase, partial [Shewanella sp. MBTL60-007]|uniref:glycosyltransferase n=1 Tax=Shewanella sp. MBTL60-007 TaxID=2815911 RepID=UPI001C82447F
MISKTKICAVIVTFNPEMSRFLDNVDAVTKQVDELIVVDNGSTNIAIIEKELREKDIICTLIPLMDNKGIGAALNRAIEY